MKSRERETTHPIHTVLITLAVLAALDDSRVDMPQPPGLVVSKPNPVVRIQRPLLQSASTGRAPWIADSHASTSYSSLGSSDVLSVDVSIDVAKLELGTGLDVRTGLNGRGRESESAIA